MTSPAARVQFADSVRYKTLAELVPIPSSHAQGEASLVIDLFTDIRCPFSFLSVRRLQRALDTLGLTATIRYHPVFLDPNVPQEGADLDEYLACEFGYTKEYTHSEEYP